MAWMMEHAKNKIHAISVGVCSHKKWWEFYFFIGRQPVTEPKRSGGCMACSFPEEVHNPRRSPPNPWRPTPHATLFPLFSPKRCLFRSFHASYLSYFVKLRPKNNSFFHINAPALLLKQPLFVLMQLFFTFTPI